MTTIIDTNHNVTPHLPALTALGVKTIIRYINPGNPSGEKTVKPAEAKAIAAVGMRLGLVCEGWGGAENFAHHDISAEHGKFDAEFCLAYAETLGAPDNACIYFAVDTDASAHQIQALVLPYFQAILAVFTEDQPYRIGVYGSGATCQAVYDADLVDLTWLSCSLGWDGSREYLASNQWAIRQHTPQKIAGIDTDPDDGNGDIGDFVPFGIPAGKDPLVA